MNDSKHIWAQVRRDNPKSVMFNFLLQDVWFAHFKEVFNPSYDSSVHNVKTGSIRDDHPLELITDDLLYGDITEEKTLEAIAPLRPEKALVLIPMWMRSFKPQSMSLYFFFTRVFSRIVLQWYISSEWTNAIIVPTFKNGNIYDPNNIQRNFHA